MQRVVEASILGRFSEAGLYLSTALAEFAVSKRHPPLDEWPQRIRKLCRQIQSHPGHGWNVPDMAAEYHCDPDHFARVFRRITGVTPGRYVIRCRVERAGFLPRHGDDPMKAIANELRLL